MKRSKFLKILGLGAGAAVAAPLVIAEVLKEEGTLIPNGGNSPHILKDSFEVTNSDMSEIKWVETKDGNYIWYTQQEMKHRMKFEEEMRRKLFEIHGNDTLSGFMRKTGKV